MGNWKRHLDFGLSITFGRDWNDTMAWRPMPGVTAAAKPANKPVGHYMNYNCARFSCKFICDFVTLVQAVTISCSCAKTNDRNSYKRELTIEADMSTLGTVQYREVDNVRFQWI